MGCCWHIAGVICDNCRPIYLQPALPTWNVPILACEHCYCVAVEVNTARPVPHKRCCKCGDVRAAGTFYISGRVSV